MMPRSSAATSATVLTIDPGKIGVSECQRALARSRIVEAANEKRGPGISLPRCSVFAKAGRLRPHAGGEGTQQGGGDDLRHLRLVRPHLHSLVLQPGRHLQGMTLSPSVL